MPMLGKSAILAAHDTLSSHTKILKLAAVGQKSAIYIYLSTIGDVANPLSNHTKMRCCL